MRIYQSWHCKAYFVIVFVPSLLVVFSLAGKSYYTISLDLYYLILHYVMTIK